jgi:hypothetical protein
MAWLSDWAKRTKGTLDSAGAKISADLTHFAVPLKIAASCGIAGGDMSRVFDEVGSDYLKIAITKSDGTTQLYGEVEKWDATAEDALIWVSKSDWVISSAADEEIYIYYDSSQADNTTYIGTPGNRTEVWDSDFITVWHLSSLIDSTANSLNLSVANGSPFITDSLLGDGYDFKTTGDRCTLSADDNDLFDTNQVTLQATINTDSSSAQQLIATKRYAASSSPYNQYSLDIEDNVRYSVGTTGGLVNVAAPITASVWNILHLRYDQINLKGFLNGNEEDSVAESRDLVTGSAKFWIGSDINHNAWVYGGVIDEVRVSKVARSAAWIKADYHAQTDNLLTWGAEEAMTLYEVSGFVKEDGTPVERTVRLYKRSDGSLIEETISDYEDGSFLFDGLEDNTIEYYVIALDNTSDETDYNALIYDRITPAETT